jgi:hypothetical protein
MSEPVAAYAVPRPAGRQSDFIIYVDESGDHSLESIDPEYPVFVADLTARPIGLTVLRPGQENRAAAVLEGKFYRDKTGNKLGMGLKVFP